QPTFSVGTTFLVGLRHAWADDLWEVAPLEGSTKENAREADDARKDRPVKERDLHTQSFAVENAVKENLGAVKLHVSTKRDPGAKDFEVFDLGKVHPRGRVLKKVAEEKRRYVYAELRIGDKLKSTAVVAPEGQFLEAVTFEVLSFVADKSLKVRAV